MPQVVKSLRKCPECGASTPSDQKVCENCGHNKDHKRRFSLSEAFSSRKSEIDKRFQTTEDQTKLQRFGNQIGRMFWLAYMGLIVFVLYFVTLFSG